MVDIIKKPNKKRNIKIKHSIHHKENAHPGNRIIHASLTRDSLLIGHNRIAGNNFYDGIYAIPLEDIEKDPLKFLVKHISYDQPEENLLLKTKYNIIAACKNNEHNATIIELQSVCVNYCQDCICGRPKHLSLAAKAINSLSSKSNSPISIKRKLFNILYMPKKILSRMPITIICSIPIMICLIGSKIIFG